MSNKNPKIKNYPRASRGVTLVEIVVAISLVGIIITVFASTFIGLKFANEMRTKNRASTLAETGLEALRSLSSADITDQTEKSFLGTLINQGVWEVKASDDAPSSPNILDEKNSSPPSEGISGLLLLSSQKIATSTIEASLLWVPENSASGTAKTGFIMRGRDITHGYYYSISPTDILLEKINGDEVTTLFSRPEIYASSTWHKLKAAVEGNSFSLFYNDILIGTATDSLFTNGETAIFSKYALISIDDLSISGDSSNSWNFDGDETGTVPQNLKRVGFGDLLDGRGILTITDAYGESDDLKKATTRVFWTSFQGVKSVEATTFINK